MNEFTQGLIVSALGLSITFAALGLVVVVITLLTRLFQPPPVAVSAPTVNTVTAPATAQAEETQIAIAIVLALKHLRATQADHLGADLNVGHSLWWKPNRLPTISRRPK